MFTGLEGPVEVFLYWPEAVFGNFYWPGAIGLPLASSPDCCVWITCDLEIVFTVGDLTITSIRCLLLKVI